MRIQEFIARQYNNQDGNIRQCSSVFKDGKGNIYSYGYHYPLAFNIGGYNFLNVKGYSVSTRRHIGWAGQAIGWSNLIEVKIPDHLSLSELNLAKIRQILVDEAVELQMTLARKKRTDTRVYADLSQELNRLQDDIKAITA